MVSLKQIELLIKENTPGFLEVAIIFAIKDHNMNVIDVAKMIYYNTKIESHSLNFDNKLIKFNRINLTNNPTNNQYKYKFKVYDSDNVYIKTYHGSVIIITFVECLVDLITDYIKKHEL